MVQLVEGYFMRPFFTVLFLICLALNAHADAKLTCLDKGKIRYRKFGQMVTENAAFCFDKEAGSLESLNCSKKSCEALNALTKKTDASPAVSAAFGTPGFHACRSAGGEPQMIEYNNGTDWQPADRCIFKSDNSFVNTTRLLAH
jgi:hypothetical protein